MAAQEVAKGKIICTEGQPLDAIHIIVAGSVKAHFSGGDIILKKGDIVGLCDVGSDSHFFTYTTLETSSFVSFPIKGKATVAAIAKANPEVGKMMLSSIINQVSLIFASYKTATATCTTLFEKINSLYTEYADLCTQNNVISRSLPGIEDLAPVELEDVPDDWVLPYYISMKEFPPELRMALSSRVAFLNGLINKASADVHTVFTPLSEMEDYCVEISKLLLQESGLDLFDLYSSLLFKLKQGTPAAEKVKSTIDEIVTLAKQGGHVEASVVDAKYGEYSAKFSGLSDDSAASEDSAAPTSQDLQEATDIILDYSDISDEDKNKFKTLLNQYKKLSDKASTEDAARKLRLDLTKAFYQVYNEAFKRSILEIKVPRILLMFFNFGFVDAELAGMDNANYLYRIAEDFRGEPYKGVYTIYEWLSAIYKMQKEPCRNEFDADFQAALHEMRIQGKITEAEEKAMFKDPEERLMFELTNMFPMCNKVTYGRLSSFCPVLCESDIIKPLQSCIVTVDAIEESYRKLEAIDYGALYRETIYTNDACGISREMINVRVIPDIILMPNVGTRGVMWQEIEGKKRTTPSRFMLSVFHIEDLPTTIVRLVGEYRWEMCKRVQGARWNDVSERSLTSEYFDYIQFYKKNNELSADAKEKIKNSLSKAKNSFKEMFVRDYITWILFEGTGSPRLNKLVRGIMVTYCPFPLELRQKIGANPMFKDFIERYEIKTSQKLHHYDNVIQKITASGQEVPAELAENRKFIEGTIKVG